MNRRQGLRMAALAAVVAVAAAGCASGSVTTAAMVQTDRGQVGIAMPTKTSPRWIADGDNMVKQFSLLGYRTDLEYADNNVPGQVAQIDKMIKSGVKALVIAAVDGSALTNVLSEAAAAKIPVIAYDRLIRDTPNINYYATFDNFKVGVQQATYLVNALGGGQHTIELFAGSPDDNNATFFFNGAMSVLQPYISSGRYVVHSGQTGFAQVATMRWDGAVAKQRMAALLSGPDASVHVDGVLSPYDGLSRGILDALKAAGYGGSGKQLPIITGQDAELDSVKLIVSGQQSETIYKDTRELAKVAVQMVNSLLTGGTPEVNDTKQYNNGVKVVPTFLLQPISVDKSNYQRILVDGGYYTAAQISG